MAPGGQAGTSSKIENYLGFPTGISGQALAGRAQVQAQKFGARLALSRAVVGLDCDARARTRSSSTDGESIRGPRRSSIATGARYRKLDVAGLRALRGRRHLLRGDGDGGASSAPTRRSSSSAAATRPARPRSSSRAARARAHARSRRGPGGDDVGLPGAADRALGPDHPASALRGDARSRATPRCASVTWTDAASGASETTRPARSIFVMIGAEPNTRVVAGCLELDAQGFVCTGARAGADADSPYATSRARRLRGRRRALGIGQARRLGRRRRLGRGPGDPSLPQPGACLGGGAAGAAGKPLAQLSKHAKDCLDADPPARRDHDAPGRGRRGHREPDEPARPRPHHRRRRRRPERHRHLFAGRRAVPLRARLDAVPDDAADDRHPDAVARASAG